MHSSAAQCRYLLGQIAEPMLADLENKHLAIEPQPGVKTAGWIIGHLAVTGDFARRLCGRQPICPKDWRDRFNPGTQPSKNQSDYPTVDELRDAFRAVYADLCDAAVSANPAQLAAENPYAPGRAGFPTAGDFVEYLLAAHLGYHLGQLRAWRAAAGVAQQGSQDTVAA